MKARRWLWEALIMSGIIAHSGPLLAGDCLEGSGVAKSEVREVADFDEIDVDGSFEVFISFNRKQTITITADDNLLPEIKTTVKNHKLSVFSKGSICTQVGLRIDIAAAQIKAISADGSIDLVMSQIKNDQLRLKFDGAGDVELSGHTQTFFATIDGTVDLQASGLKTEITEIALDGAGDAEVYATKKLKASIDGAGSITYGGNPEDVIQDISGAGEISKE